MRRGNTTLIAVAMLAAASPAWAQSGGSPVVVELFTSEGCSSCPPADALLFDLREDDDVLALAFHVDYWDYLGWQDRFASHDFTNRQRGYARALGSPMVYTPQLVVNGADHVVGSARSKVYAAIAEAREKRTVNLDIGLSMDDHQALTVSIPAATYHGEATIWFVRYALEADSTITSGENAGRLLRHANVVEELTAIGMWKGEAMDITLPWEAIEGEADDDEYEGFGCAIIVQQEGLGPILGAREITWDRHPAS
jgi:hypothetical protein